MDNKLHRPVTTAVAGTTKGPLRKGRFFRVWLGAELIAMSFSILSLMSRRSFFEEGLDSEP